MARQLPGGLTRGSVGIVRKLLSKRNILLSSLSVVAIPLGAVAVTAYACTSVATLSPSAASALPGTTITVNGEFFGTHDPSDATTAGPVELRLGSLSGPVLADASPSGINGAFTVQVTIPASAAPGQTFITATQNDATGVPVYGTPARQAFTVAAPAVAPPPTYGPVSFTPPAPSCVVPRVAGVSESTAKTMIRNSHCTVGKVMTPRKPRAKHHRYKLVVAGADQSAGTTLANGSRINIRMRWK